MKVKLSEVSSGFTKNIAQKDLDNNNGCYPIYGASGYIKNINFYISDKPYIGIVKDGSGVGRVNIYPAYSSLLGTMQYVVPNDNMDIAYLMYALRYMKLGSLYSGAAIPHIYYKNYQRNELNYREKNEQKSISTQLTQIENAILVCNAKIIALDELVKSRFIEMFGTLDLSIQGETWLPLSDVSTIFTGTTPSTKDSENWNGDIPWVTPAELSDDSFVVCDTERKITQKGMKSKSLSLMPKNTVLLSTRAPIGKVAITGIEMCCNQGFKNFYCNNTVLNPIYLYTLLRNNSEYLNSLGTGTTFKEISKKNASNIKVPVADISLQNEFADFVKLIDKSKFVGYFTLNIFYVKSSHFHHPP